MASGDEQTFRDRIKEGLSDIAGMCRRLLRASRFLCPTHCEKRLSEKMPMFSENDDGQSATATAVARHYRYVTRRHRTVGTDSA